MNLSNKKKVIFRTIEEIGQLTPDMYGIPSTSNFPLIDSVLQPDTLFQFTTSNRHRGSNAKLDEIREHLEEKNLGMHKMIFIVPHENLYSFRTVADLPIRQYVMSGEHVHSQVSGSTRPFPESETAETIPKKRAKARAPK